jgi:hypothetical protein
VHRHPGDRGVGEVVAEQLQRPGQRPEARHRREQEPDPGPARVRPGPQHRDPERDQPEQQEEQCDVPVGVEPGRRLVGHAAVAHQVRSILGGRPDLEVVGEAADGVAAVEQAARTRPDVV